MIGAVWEMQGTGKTARLYLHDPHQEYTGNLTIRVHTPGVYLNAGIIWDEMELTDAYCDARGDTNTRDNWDIAMEKITEARIALFPSWPEEWGLGLGVVWKIEGNLAGLTACFISLANALDTVPSGDDDVFDYWPNTMDMLQEFAEDLREVYGESSYKARVLQIYARVKSHFLHPTNITSIDFDEEVWHPNA